MSDHAVFAPSASHRWISCSASIKMSEGIAETTSVYAHEGSVCHEVAAICLRENKDADEFTGQVVDEVQMTKELIEGIQMYVDEVKGQTKEYNMSGGRVELEVQITEDCWGTLDMALWNPDLLVIDDLKMGKGVIVPAENNTQLMIYAVGALKWLQQEKGINPKKVIMFIIQPRTVNPVRKFEMSREDLIMWFRETVKPAIEQIKSGEVECIPGEDQCRWCPATAVCTVQAQHAINTAERAFAPFTEEVKPEIETATGSTLSLREIARLLPSLSHIKDWIKSIESYALAKALEGTHIPGHKLVRGRSNRKWKTDDAVIAKWLISKGYEAYDEAPLLSITKVEKAMGKKEAQAFGLDNYVTKPPGAPTLVIESDKRPTMDLVADKAFEEFATDIVGELAGAGLTNVVVVDESTDLTEVKIPDPIVVVSDEAESGALSRMMAAIDDEEDELPDVSIADVFDVDIEPKVATDTYVILSAKPDGKPVPPAKAQKRLEILNMGKGGASLEDVAKALNCSVNTVKMHIRYLNERDGYGYEIYGDGTFKIIE